MLYAELLQLLARPQHDWGPKPLLKLTRILAGNKIGEDQLWLSIEKRVSKYLEGPVGETLKDQLVRIAQGFNTMDKGSFQFWSAVNTALDSKAKKDLLAKTKIPNTLAHIHLKP